MKDLKTVIATLKPERYVVLDRNKMPVDPSMLKALDLADVYVLKQEEKDGKTVIHSDIHSGGC